MKKISRVINLLPCPNLDDFPTHHQGQDAESLLANWSAAWHPELIAATGSRPLWCSTEQTTSPAEPDSACGDELVVEETDPYLSDLYPAGEDVDHQPTGQHGGPHAPAPYDGSPFRLPQQTDDERSNKDDSQPRVNPLWQDSVLFIPTVSMWSLHDEFAASAAAPSAAMIAGHTDRDEIAQRLAGILGLRTDDVSKHWASEFYAVGYAWLQVQLLTRKIRYSSNLNTDSPKTLGESLKTELESAHHSNFHMTGDTINALTDRSPASAASQFELPAPLLSKDSALNQIVQCAETAKRVLDVEPKIFLRRRAGLTSDLPQLLEQLEFVGALHVSFDRGRVPPSSSGTIAWSGPSDGSIMAKTETPLDASEAATFLDFSVQFGRQLDSEHSATMMLVHWPGKTQSTFRDLVRVSARSPVLGTFQTLENHFDEIYDPGYGDTFLPDEYRPGYLSEACKSGSSAPVSSIVSYWRHNWQLTSLAHFNTWIALAGKANSSIDSAGINECSAIAERIRSAQQLIEQQTESWQPSATEIDTQINAIEDSAVQLLRRVCGCESEDDTATILLNPLGFRRRLAVQTAFNTTTQQTAFSKSQKPFQLAAMNTDKPGCHWIMDVDSFGATRLEKYETASSSDANREPDVLEGDKLQNEFFVAAIDAKTGGLRSIHFHGKRGNRGGQRIVYHDHTRPNVSSQMICRSMKPVALSKIGGQIETAGTILFDGEEVAEFRQTFRLLRGQRHLEIEIELTPKILLPSSASTWFASQLAWQDESCSLHAACQLAKFEAVDPQIQSPNFVQISMTDYSLTLLSGGLPAHRRTARCKLDTMLIVGNEQQRNFRLGIGVNISHAARAASHFNSPVYAIDQLPLAETKNGALSSCLLHLDCKNIILTFSEPVFADGKLVAIRLRFQETEGRAGRLHISTALLLKNVKRQDLLGDTVEDLSISDNPHRVGLDFSRHDFFQLELQV